MSRWRYPSVPLGRCISLVRTVRQWVLPNGTYIRKSAVCVAHGPCPDGHLAAQMVVAACEAVDVAVQLHWVQPGAPFDLAAAVRDKPGLLFVLDVCFSLDEMRAAGEHVGWDRVVFVDHHQSNAKTMLALRAEQARHTPVPSISFATPYAACHLTWCFLYPNEPVPALVAAIADQDTRRCVVPGSAAFKRAAIERGLTKGLSEELLRAIYDPPPGWADEMVAEGKTLIARDEPAVAAACASAHLTRWVLDPAHPLAGPLVAVVADTPWQLRVAIAERCIAVHRCQCVVFPWASATEPRHRVTFMSEYDRTGFSTLPLAQALGGGGHPGCSGATMPTGDAWCAHVVDAPASPAVAASNGNAGAQ